MERGWIGVDLDGTLATYAGWQGAHNIGLPIALMVDRVKQWVAEGKNVRIMTARVYSDGTPERDHDAEVSRDRIAEWCLAHLGFRLPITCTKDYGMIELWDDRCVQVVPNAGEAVQNIAREAGSLLKALAVWHGAVHENQCPCDDTCDCRYRAFNDAVELTIRRIERAVGECPELDPDNQMKEV